MIVVFVTVCSAVVLRLAFLVRMHHRHNQAAGSERGAHALVASVIGLVAILPVAIGAPFGESDRFDVRELRSDSSTIDEEISPLSRLDEWRSLSPARELFTVSPADGDERWRIVALTRYDGRAWMPSDDFRPVGEELQVAPRSASRQRFDVRIEELAEAWAPFVGEPLATDLTARVDVTLSGIRLPNRFTPGDEYRLEVADRTLTDAQKEVAIPDYDLDLPAFGEDLAVTETQIQTLAAEFVSGATSDYGRASTLATRLATSYKLDDDAPAGHSLPQLRLFLTSTKAGRDEQFIAAYALLARAIGLPVRIAVGVQLTDQGDHSSASSASVVAWPEIAFEGIGWVAFDPIPEQLTESPEETQAGQPVGASGEAAPPPTTAPSPSETQPSNPPPPQVTGDGSLSVANRFALVGVLLLLALIAYVSTVLTMKRNRRVRRAQAMRSDERIAGAFLSSVEQAVDLGAPAGPTLTNRELAMSSSPVIGRGAEPLGELARLATRAVYDTEEPGPEVAELAWEQARLVSSESARSAGRLRWARARLSLRSLRLDGLDGPATNEPERRRRRSIR